MQILIIEDNIKLAQNLADIIGGQGYTSKVCHDGLSGITETRKSDYDLIILDLNLPDIDGLEVCKVLRKQGERSPIIMLTARIDTESKISGLDSGADDYLTKPFSAEELLARIRAVMRREASRKSAVVTIGDVRVDLNAKQVFVNDVQVNISDTQMRIIEFLLSNSGHACTAGQIYDAVWADTSGDMLFSDTLKVHIARIRKKLGQDFIKTAPGQSYLIP